MRAADERDPLRQLPPAIRARFRDRLPRSSGPVAETLGTAPWEGAHARPASRARGRDACSPLKGAARAQSEPTGGSFDLTVSESTWRPAAFAGAGRRSQAGPPRPVGRGRGRGGAARARRPRRSAPGEEAPYPSGRIHAMLAEHSQISDDPKFLDIRGMGLSPDGGAAGRRMSLRAPKKNAWLTL